MSAAPRLRAIRALALLAVLVVASAGLGSCAYYNTFYLAKKYYFRATDGRPYEVDRVGTAQVANYTKAIDFSKKVMSSYPKSGWVDDAYIMWAKSLLGRDDPLQTVNMLQDFDSRFPDSPVKAEATFFLGVGHRQSRKYARAVDAFDRYLQMAPRGPLAPYAHLERSRALTSLERFGEAADAAGRILADFPRSELAGRARLARAEARFKQGDFAGARDDFRVIGTEAPNDEQRFNFLLREADCLEAARQYDEELALLREALSHEVAPAPPPQNDALNPPSVVITQTVAPGADRYGRLTLRVGTVHMLAGRLDEALQAYRNVIQDYPRTNLSAEAQYRVGYAYETAGDDFDRAATEYAAVKDQAPQSAFNTQAQQRLANLDRIKQFRTGSGADSLEKRAEAGFLVAEQYLFQLDKPDRAVEEYRRVAEAYPGTPVAGRALNAQAWVLSRKLQRPREADSLFWKVVREYPATEAQLAARDYLELAGQSVDPSLIVAPKPKVVPAPDTTAALTPPPATTPPLAPPPGGVLPMGAPGDSLAARRAGFPGGRPRGGIMGSAYGDSIRRVMQARRDSLAMPPGMPPAARDSASTPRDTTAAPDSSRGSGG